MLEGDEEGSTDDELDGFVVDVAEELDNEVDIPLVVEVSHEVAAAPDDVEIPFVEFCQAEPTAFAFMVTPLVSPPVE